MMHATDAALVKAALRNVEHALEELKSDKPMAMFRSSLDLLDAIQYLKIALPKDAA